MRIINKIRFRTIMIGCSFLFGLTPVFSAIQLVTQKSDTLLFKVTFDSVSTQKDDSGTSSGIIPHKEVLLLQAESGMINTSILKTVYGDEEIDPNLLVEDIALGLEDQPDQKVNVNLPSNPIQIQKINQSNVYRLTLHGMIASGDRKAKSIQEIQVYCTGSRIAWIDDATSRTKMIKAYKESAALLAKSSQPQIDASALPYQSSKLLKIWVKKEGIYTIPRSMMIEAGWDVRNVNPRYFRMTNQGKEVPIYVTGETDGSFDLTDCVEFYGDRLWRYDENGDKQLDVYSEYNIYMLEIGISPGLRLVEESGQPSLEKDKNTIVPKYYMYTEHIEENSYLYRLGYAESVSSEDYRTMIPYIHNLEKKDFSISIPGLVEQGEYLSSIKMKLQGETQSVDDQEVEVFLNQYLIDKEGWTGNSTIISTSQPFSSLYFNSKINTITIYNASDSNLPVKVFGDWIEVTYPREYKAIDDYIPFFPSPNSIDKRCRFEIEGFRIPDISIYKPYSSRIFNSSVEEVVDTLGQVSYTLIFEDDIQNIDTKYIVLSNDEKLLPDSTAYVELQGIRSLEFEGDYVIVTPSDSLGRELLQPLIDLHEAEGLQVTCVSIDTVYNEFSFGIPNPLAIQAFLKYGCFNWQIKPKFLLLIGDADYYHPFDPTKSLLPSPWHQTYKFGGVPSDHVFTLLDGDDDIPELALGRFPVFNREELIKLVEKTVNYINEPHASWQNRYLLIGADAKGGTFYNQSEYIIANIFPGKIEPKRLYLAGSLITDPFVGGPTELKQYFANGISMLNFRGHGGGGIWQDYQLMGNEEVEKLDNINKLPIITSMTCYTGDFASSIDCLGETMILAENGGAIGFMGATGVGWTDADYNLIREIFKIMMDNPELTIGEAIQQGKTMARLKYSNVELISDIYQYTYLGDPAVKLPFPTQEVSLTSTSSPSIESDGTIQVEGVTSTANCQAEFQVFEDNGNTISTISEQLSGTSFQKSIPIDSLSQAKGLRIHVWDEQSDYHANAYFDFTIGSMYVDSLQILPADLCASDSLYFQTDLAFYRPLESVYVLIFNTQIDSGIVLPDSILLLPVNQTSRYRSSSKLPPLGARNRFNYSLRLKDTDGQIHQGDTLTYTYPSLPSFGVQSISLLDSNQVYLQAKIRNNGGLWVKNLPIQINIPSLSYQVTDTISIKGGAAVTSIAPLSTPVGNYLCDVIIDPNEFVDRLKTHFDTLETTVAMNRAWITPENGSTIYNTQTDTVGLDNQIWIFASPQTVDVANVIRMEYAYEYLGDLSEIDSTTVDTTLFVKNMTLSSASENIHFNKPFQLIVYGPQSVFNSKSKLQFFDMETNRWITQQFVSVDSFFISGIDQLGTYRLINATDVQSPWISVTADHQPVANGCYLDKQATLMISIEDDFGVDIRPESIQISLDQKQYALTEMTWQDSLADPTKASFMFSPELKNGTHVLTIQAMDIYGNMNQLAPIQFTVNEDMDVKFLGNYPNPFEESTIFTYMLTTNAKQVKLKIYTVSGRLIKTFDDLSMVSADYHEVVWDGRDDWGDEVANGVYFFKLSVTGFEKSMDIKGKIAKLRL